MDIQSDKKQLRLRMTVLRDAMAPADREERSLRIADHALSLIREAGPGSGKAVLVYVPFRSEANTWPLIRALWQDKRHVAAPRTDRATGTLSLYRLDDERQLQPGAWGIPEPDPARCQRLEHADIGTVIVPGLAFDRQGGRLGYGAGYYDRLFRGMLAAGQKLPLRIGFAFANQLVEAVPMDSGDFPVDWLATEDACWQAAGSCS